MFHVSRDTVRMNTDWGVGRRRRRRDGLCPNCAERPNQSSGYCKPCKAEYARRRRALGKGQRYATMTADQKLRSRARAYARVYLRRGKLQRGPCERCGSDRAQMHHHDYTRPLEIYWICKDCREVQAA